MKLKDFFKDKNAIETQNTPLVVELWNMHISLRKNTYKLWMKSHSLLKMKFTLIRSYLLTMLFSLYFAEVFPPSFFYQLLEDLC